jgi:ArsR family transcriptional regulator
VTSKLERHALQLQALGNPVRLLIVRLLVQGGPSGTSAGDIQTRVDMPASTLSHHLSRLLQAGLITTRGEGTFHYYAPDISALRTLTNYLWQDCCKGGVC